MDEPKYYMIIVEVRTVNGEEEPNTLQVFDVTQLWKEKIAMGAKLIGINIDHNGDVGINLEEKGEV